jgi:membrane dipeptidase
MFFDAHCDTILEVCEHEADFVAGPGLHVTLRGLRRADVRAQVFACCVPEAQHPGRARERALELVAAVRALPGVAVVRNPADLARSLASKVAPDEVAGGGSPVAAIIALEGADPLMGQLDVLREFHRAGVRLLTLAWDDNPFCGAVFGAGAGLTREGEDLVQLCEELGVMVDVSHASDAAFSDVCRLARRPFVASHSDCRALCESPRNLSDEMIRALAHRGGVMGINLYPGFLWQPSFEAGRRNDERFWDAVRGGQSFDEAGRQASQAAAHLPRAPLEAVAAHVKHAIYVGGEDCVGLGGDLDGIDSLPVGIGAVDDYPKLAELLCEQGLSADQVEKVCWRNFARVFRA